jgi:DNA polymerase I
VLNHLPFREIWVADFEFNANSGERPDIICLVALELRSGRKLRLWSDQLGPRPPFPIDASSLIVAFFASADLGCFKVLNWPMPARILDPFVEFRNSTNMLQQKGCKPVESSLIAALAAHGLDTIGAIEKERMRALILRGDPWSVEERKEILDYCESDVAALARLLSAMSPRIDLPRALLRGRYMAAVAAMRVIVF